MSFNLANHIPALRYKKIASVTWGAGGNTSTITDQNVGTNSQVEYWVTGTVPQAGQWAIAVNQGNFVFTSSDSESSTLPISYIIF
jgi:hypothetical protein